MFTTYASVTSSSGASIQTVSGTTTSWLPLTTPWDSNAACSTQAYALPNESPVIFDPYYQTVVNPGINSAACLPPEATAWRNQAADAPILLGPTFHCPAAYSTVDTIAVNSATTQVLCCPSNFGLQTPITQRTNGAFPSQCTSVLSSGETYDYMTSISGSWRPFTNQLMESYTVYAVHVNGFNVQAEITAAPGGASISTTSSQSESTPISPVAVAFLGFTAVLLLASLFAVFIYFYRSRKRRQTPGEHGTKLYTPDDTDQMYQPYPLPNYAEGPIPPPHKFKPNTEGLYIPSIQKTKAPPTSIPKADGEVSCYAESHGGGWKSTQRNTMFFEIGSGRRSENYTKNIMHAKEQQLWMT